MKRRAFYIVRCRNGSVERFTTVAEADAFFYEEHPERRVSEPWFLPDGQPNPAALPERIPQPHLRWKE